MEAQSVSVLIKGSANTVLNSQPAVEAAGASVVAPGVSAGAAGAGVVGLAGAAGAAGVAGSAGASAGGGPTGASEDGQPARVRPRIIVPNRLRILLFLL